MEDMGWDRVERENSLACTAGRIALFIKIRKTGEKPVWGENQV